jgi:hypothetical protein
MLKTSNICFFMADVSGGRNGGSDPHDYDDLLANQFRQALVLQISRNLSTINPFGIVDHSKPIFERIEQVGQCLILLSKDLQPIAEALLEIAGPSDRENGQVISYKAAIKLGFMS